MVVAQREVAGSQPTKLAVIDCDIHVTPKGPETLGKYMPERWRGHHERFGGRGHAGSYYPRANQNAARTDSWPPNGGPPGWRRGRRPPGRGPRARRPRRGKPRAPTAAQAADRKRRSAPSRPRRAGYGRGPAPGPRRSRRPGRAPRGPRFAPSTPLLPAFAQRLTQWLRREQNEPNQCENMERVALTTTLGKLLDWCSQQKATDLHVQADRRYAYRVDGKLLRISPQQFPVPTNEEIMGDPTASFLQLYL